MVSFTQMLARDTSAGAEDLQIELHRRLTPSNRLAMAIEMSEFARQLSRIGLHSRHPELTEAELDREMLFQLYGFTFRRQ
jgi:hypothetical protein